MKAFFDQRQYLHDPKHFLARGKPQPSPEQPERITRLISGAEKAGLVFEAPSDQGMAPVAAVHSPEYLVFLKNIYARWQKLENAGPEVIPNVHPASRLDTYPQSVIGQAGYHQADTACPIAQHTYKAAYWSAQNAVAGADALVEGEARCYALCRPPGHHAFRDMAGGFCFLNNAAIAAERLRRHGHRPAILDVDVHHGNGTQGIFYKRSDVLTVSLHADPDDFYPFFWGHALERGEDEGLGYNLNLPLKRGKKDEDYLKVLDLALERINVFGATVIVVALGLDAHEDDPFRGLAISTDGFERIGAAIASIGLPSLFVQEGGYLSDALAQNLASFLLGVQA